MHRLALRAEDAAEIKERFRAAEPSEAGVFLLVRAATTRAGLRLVASAPYFPEAHEVKRVGLGVFTPSSQLLSKMVSRSVSEKAGLLFLHSHPDPRYPAGFSDVDWAALNELELVMPDLLEGPFAAGVVSPRGWTGSVLTENGWEEIPRITVAGRSLTMLEPDAPLPHDPLSDRQELALGRINDRLRRIRVALIGAGGLGSPLAETLHRMGVELLVVDGDRIDTLSNLRRVFGAKAVHLKDKPFKAECVAEHCRAVGLGTRIEAVPLDVRHKDVLPILLDCDVLICGTDTHGSRAFLNSVAYAFHLPLIDCGVRPALLGNGELECLSGEVRLVSPGLPCLWCTSSIDADRVREENLPRSERERLAREGYGTGTDEAVPSVAALTVGGAGFMASALVGVLADSGEHRPTRYYFDLLNGVAGERQSARREKCLCRQSEGRGGSGSLAFL